MSKTNGKHRHNPELLRWQQDQQDQKQLRDNYPDLYNSKYGGGDPETIYLQNKIEAKTENQKIYIDFLRKKIVTIVYGPAGTGKSMCALGVAAEKFAKGDIEQILITRSLVDCGKQMPALPGDLQDKVQFHFASYLDYLYHFLGEQETRRAIRSEKILLRPIEMLRGHTYKNCYMIADEAQNLAKKQIKMFMSRIGEGSQIAMLGDEKQSDNFENGLSFCLDRMNESRYLGIAELTKEDILRHPIISEVLEAFDED